ncbi:uncharacterized protein LOC124665933 [Lolium rigidum]|uniref:uncharacterized protein LOC124665933 n=1 Tax=Lolium rigidum TaxID=89674 RepID=UPI001F5D8F75|nr:uncharacterized protein LOC124665933 [Lolium rigidum]
MGKYYKMTFIATEVENSDGCYSRPGRYAGKISLMEMLTDAPTTASAKKRGMDCLQVILLSRRCHQQETQKTALSTEKSSMASPSGESPNTTADSRALDATPSKDIIEKAESDVDDDVSSVSERKKSKATASDSASTKKQVSKALFPRQ